jgi:hypothetical protein
MQVIRFTLKGMPGHSAVTAKVEFKGLHRSQAFKKIQLATAGDKQQQQQQPSAKRRKTS